MSCLLPSDHFRNRRVRYEPLLTNVTLKPLPEKNNVKKKKLLMFSKKQNSENLMPPIQDINIRM